MDRHGISAPAMDTITPVVDKHQVDMVDPDQLETGSVNEKHLVQMDDHLTFVDGQLREDRGLFSFKEAARLKRKADWRLLPLLVMAYLIKNIDNNLPPYLKTMNSGESTNILKQLHMTSDDYGLISTCFTVGFVISEIPSNMLIKWSTPRLHFVRILTLWSVINACHAACRTKESLYACRVLLGIMEGGLYPGAIYQLMCWYRPDEIAVRLACLQLTGQFSGIVDALVCYGLSFISGKGGLAGWQWAFIITGCLGLVFSSVIFMFLPDWPDSPQTRFRSVLTEEEGRFMVARLPPTTSRSSDENFDWAAIRRELRSPLLYAFTAMNIFINSAQYGVAFWLPTLVAGFGLTSPTNSQLLNIPTAVVYIIAALAQGWILDNTTRIPKPAMMLTYAAVMAGLFFGLIFCTNPAGLYTLIVLLYIPLAGFLVTMMPLRVQSVGGSSGSAFVVAFMNGLGNIPSLYTAQFFLSRYGPRFQASFGICIAFVGAAAIAVCVIWYFQRSVEANTRRIAKLRRERGKRNETIDEDVVA